MLAEDPDTGSPSSITISLDRIRICFSNLILRTLCEKPVKGRQKALFWLLLLFFLVFSQLNIFWKFELTTFPFSLSKVSSIFIIIFNNWEKTVIRQSFSMSTQFKHLNTAEKLGIFKFVNLFHFVNISYSLPSRLLPASTAVFNCPP